jgi:hypothetical protein
MLGGVKITKKTREHAAEMLRIARLTDQQSQPDREQASKAG